MLKAIKLTNLLSFGAETEITFNKGLNVLIGANGSGKSNLIEVISLLQALPKDLTKVIRDGGGVDEWLWKGENHPLKFATIEVVKNEVIEDEYGLNRSINYKHTLEFINYNSSFRVHIESIKTNIDTESYKDIYSKKDYVDDNGDYIFYLNKPIKAVNSAQSILAQRRDPDIYPEMDYLGNFYENIQLYREWQFGRHTPPRVPQRADLPNDFLEEDASNLGLILSSFRENIEIKKKLIAAIKLFYENVEDFGVSIYGGYVQVFFEENNFKIPATRLSDGTLRYLSLLAILLHPNPPPLICIEEPELGLHPDILPTLIDLLKEAAEKTQIIITTHSVDLVDALSDTPEAVLVFDKQQGSTTVTRLNKEDLIDWLKDYSLGQLWNRGHIGGNRW